MSVLGPGEGVRRVRDGPAHARGPLGRLVPASPKSHVLIRLITAPALGPDVIVFRRLLCRIWTLPAPETTGVAMGLTDRQPTGWRRILLRLPTRLYRRGLGGLLGSRFAYLVHQGRKTGLPRDVVLEVVRYDPATPEVFVIAAWGERCDWFRNITAAPAIELRTGPHRWPRPRHRLLTAKETACLVCDYQRRHPYSWKIVAPILGLPKRPAEMVQTTRSTIKAVAFSPRLNDDELSVT